MNFFFQYLFKMIRNPLIRNIHTSCVSLKKIPNKAKSHSSNQWLSRQLNDPFVQFAKMKNYRFVTNKLNINTNFELIYSLILCMCYSNLYNITGVEVHSSYWKSMNELKSFSLVKQLSIVVRRQVHGHKSLWTKLMPMES